MSGNQSVKRAITILEYLAVVDGPRDLSVMSRDLKMSKSTVYRFLSSMGQAGYVRQDPDTRRYTLGSRVAWLAAKFLEKVALRSVARFPLEELGHECDETIHLAIPDGNEVVYIDKIDGRQAVRMASRIGFRGPMHSTALGRTMLADRPESRWERYVAEAGLVPRTPNTIVEPQEFFEHLRKVREQGYCIDDVENEEGIRCVAAPIRNHTGKVIGAVSISGWTLTMTLDKIRNLRPKVQQTALKISKELGFAAPGERGSAVKRVPGLYGPKTDKGSQQPPLGSCSIMKGVPHE
jgi:IclR family acetate operon transcriptional repressor